MINNKNYDDCPIQYTLDAISGKWKLLIIYFLMIGKVQRYGELKKSIKDISHKMLSQQLKELEEFGLIKRIEYAEIPPKVEYSLTEKGVTVFPILDLMYKWGCENIK